MDRHEPKMTQTTYGEKFKFYNFYINKRQPNFALRTTLVLKSNEKMMLGLTHWEITQRGLGTLSKGAQETRILLAIKGSSAHSGLETTK